MEGAARLGKPNSVQHQIKITCLGAADAALVTDGLGDALSHALEAVGRARRAGRALAALEGATTAVVLRAAYLACRARCLGHTGWRRQDTLRAI
jgi:hypothetical protein